MEKEIITVTKVNGDDVWYSGSLYFRGCNISLFPVTPKVGMKFVLENYFNKPSKITKYNAVKTNEKDILVGEPE